jgi:hypothetical protein
MMSTPSKMSQSPLPRLRRLPVLLPPRLLPPWQQQLPLLPVLARLPR